MLIKFNIMTKFGKIPYSIIQEPMNREWLVYIKLTRLCAHAPREVRGERTCCLSSERVSDIEEIIISFLE